MENKTLKEGDEAITVFCLVSIKLSNPSKNILCLTFSDCIKNLIRDYPALRLNLRVCNSECLSIVC